MVPETEIAQFKRLSIPLVRRIYPSLIADKLVSVQPLAGPSGLVHYLRHKYSQNKGSAMEPVMEPVWAVKKKKKVVWRSIEDPFEPQNE